MAKPDKEQKKVDESVKKSIEDEIAADLEGVDIPDDDEKETRDNPESNTDNGDSVKNRQKNIDNDDKKSDNDNDEDQPDEKELFDKVVNKVLQDEYDGDKSRIKEAKAVANMAVKTFDGDPVKAAKSYRNLYRKNSELQNTIKRSPFLEKLYNAAQNGENVDENYVKQLVGTATSNNAEQPDPSKGQSEEHNELTDDFDVDSITVEEMLESGSLDKTKYENSDPVDRKTMVEKARIRHAYKVLPDKMAERTVKLSEKKQQQVKQEEKRQQAIDTNKSRISKNLEEVMTKYDVDFEGNPEHAQLWEEVKQKMYKVPDLSDNTNMLVAENAAEVAVKHVFNENNVSLNKVNIPDTDDSPDHKIENTSSQTNAMQRILQDTTGFKGIKSKQRRSNNQGNPGNSLDDQVNERVEQNLNRGRKTSKMISGQRIKDRKRPS